MCHTLLLPHACPHTTTICTTPCVPSLATSTPCATPTSKPLPQSRYPCLRCYLKPEYTELKESWEKEYKAQHPYTRDGDVSWGAGTRESIVGEGVRLLEGRERVERERERMERMERERAEKEDIGGDGVEGRENGED